MVDHETSVQWETPLPGYWRRDFRLPEWLPAPVSASFETWLLPELDAGFVEASKAEFGMAMVLPTHTVVHGWCFATDPKVTGMLGGIARQPVRMFKMLRAFMTMATKPERFEADVARPAHEHYLEDLLPAHRRAVEDGWGRVETDGPGELMELVDDVARSSGTLMLAMVEALGFAGKAEFALAVFHTEHLRPVLGTTHLDLLAGLTDASGPASHAVASLDWIEPTTGEAGSGVGANAESPHRSRPEVIERRLEAERACRQALADQPKRAARFDEVLAIAQRWIPVREDMASDFTLSWPLLRRAMLRLGGHFRECGVIDDDADVFHLTRIEIESVTEGSNRSLASTVAERRAEREQRARLVAPMALGKPTGAWRKIDEYLRVFRMEPEVATAALVRGIPASAGVASGPVRVVGGPEDFASFQDGEVLVAAATAPAWTPLFDRAAAVVTDSGSPFAHASVVAREYGIPAVVGTGDATTRLVDGQRVTVDGRNGTVEPA